LPEPLGVHYFGDFVSAACHARLPSPYTSLIGSNYFPFSYVAMAPFGYLLRFGLLAALLPFLALSALLILVPIYRSFPPGISRNERLLALTLLVVLTYPFISMIDRGNAQGLVTGCLMCGVYLFLRDRPNSAALFLGAATALKGYPVFFLLLFVKKRQWKSLIVAATASMVLTFMPLLVFEGGPIRNAKALLTQLRTFTEGGEIWLRYNNSLKGLFLAINELSVPLLAGPSHFMSAHYTWVVMILAITLVIVGISQRIDFFQFSLLGAIFCSLLIDLSAGYVLTAFFVPLMVYFNHGVDEGRVVRIQVWLIAILMVPKGIPIKVTEYWPRADYSPSWNTVLNPTIMLVLSVLSFYYYFSKRAAAQECPNSPS